MMKRSREPQPIILPLSRYEKATQPTSVDQPGSNSLCGRCDTPTEVGGRFCGQCGMQLIPMGTILVSLNYDGIESGIGAGTAR
ncbi:hypothetical protein [Reticulibacter mediterranei]|uniref:hypothetical protein n=1 Tax=Reticulibacter mediterranei TaxID=2778369 RepID=UPI001C687607|nr:hypothetical protein [Reticulibacter mediterranei]